SVFKDPRSLFKESGSIQNDPGNVLKKDERSTIRKDELSFLKRDEPKDSGFLRKPEPLLKNDDSAPTAKLDAANTSWKTSFTMPLPSLAADASNHHDDQDHDSLLETGSTGRPMGKIAAAAVALIVISAGGVYAGRKLLTSGSAASANGTLSINS